MIKPKYGSKQFIESRKLIDELVWYKRCVYLEWGQMIKTGNLLEDRIYEYLLCREGRHLNRHIHKLIKSCRPVPYKPFNVDYWYPRIRNQFLNDEELLYLWEPKGGK